MTSLYNSADKCLIGAIKSVLVFDSNIGTLLLIWLLDENSKKKSYLHVFFYFFTWVSSIPFIYNHFSFNT